jgi:hypothetical protein
MSSGDCWDLGEKIPKNESQEKQAIVLSGMKKYPNFRDEKLSHLKGQ